MPPAVLAKNLQATEVFDFNIFNLNSRCYPAGKT